MRGFLNLFAMVAGLGAMAPCGAAVAEDAGTRPPGGGFSLPIACTIGRDCWVMNYPDMQSGPGARDPFCGPRSYDGHKGTDIAVRDIATMRLGVDVLAAADGRVAAVRDGMADRVVTAAKTAAIEGRECGNGVLVDHGDGWETQYCHMRRGSIAVKPGMRVLRGGRLGLVGLSGETAFPHVHLSVRRSGWHLDPNTGRALEEGCDAARAGSPLWRDADALPYQPGSLYAAGFATGAVAAERVKADASGPATLPAEAPAMVLWTAMLGVRAGDRLSIAIAGPDGAAVAERSVTLDRDQAWRMAYTGRQRRGAAWPAGVYRGTVRLARSGRDALDQTRTVTVVIR